jgi:hypothetical protein
MQNDIDAVEMSLRVRSSTSDLSSILAKAQALEGDLDTADQHLHERLQRADLKMMEVYSSKSVHTIHKHAQHVPQEISVSVIVSECMYIHGIWQHV